MMCGYKSQYMDGHKEKFVRLEHTSSRVSFAPDTNEISRMGFTRGPNKPSRSFRRGMQRGSEGLRTLGKSIRYGVSKAVFSEDLKVSKKNILDPQDRRLLKWNRVFVITCICSIGVDPLFFYLPIVDKDSLCLGIDHKLVNAATILRSLVDMIYLYRIFLQFRTAYIAPSSRVFGRGELVIDPALIAQRYLRRFFVVDLLAVLPFPQLVSWMYLYNLNVKATKDALYYIVIIQAIPRIFRIFPLTAELKRTAGVFAESALAGATYYMAWYMLAGNAIGASWYQLAVEREDTCWSLACISNSTFGTNNTVGCKPEFLYCGSMQVEGYDVWRNISNQVLNTYCSEEDTNPYFNFGIYLQALTTGVVLSGEFLPKFLYCFWWGLMNLSTLGQGLQTSTYVGEVMFSIFLVIGGLILLAMLIGNVQTYLQSLTVRVEEMRLKRRDSEQWMHHRLLPQELKERVRRYDQYKWMETRGVDEENIVQSLPKDLRRDIKRHLCLALVRRVPLFANMDERLLDAICERLKPSLCTENTYVLREGDPVEDMLFIIRGRLESVTTDGGRSGFFNRGFLKEGDFCGEELLTWALDPKSGANLPSSTRTVKALSEVEAFALNAEELKFVASQFRRLHSRQVQHTFRFYSQQWRTWAACFIQAAWRRYTKRKYAELRRREEEACSGSGGSSYASIGATVFASRFATNAMRGVNRMRDSKGASGREMVKLKMQKPSEPDFSEDLC